MTDKFHHTTGNPKTGSRRRRIWILASLPLVCLVVAIAFWRNGPAPQGPEGEGMSVEEKPFTAHTVPASQGLAPSAPARPVSVIPPLPPVQPALRELVNGLVKFAPPGDILTDEQAAAWKKQHEALVQQGAAAIPAIREFLASNTDYVFGKGAKPFLGYDSARMAMFDALGQIGGQLAVGVLSETLQSTADPREIAVLTQYLELLEPGVHPGTAMASAQNALAMAGQGKLPGRDVAPLFELIQRYGGIGTVPELEQYAQYWGYYATIALANLPNEQGIPTLIERAQDGKDTAAIMLLAQAARQSDTARSALIEQARQNKLNYGAIKGILGGAEVHFRDSLFDSGITAPNPNDATTISIPGSNQAYIVGPTPEALTPERVQTQVALIDELLSVTTDPTAVQTLQQAKGLLTKRATQLAGIMGGSQ